MIRPAGRAFLLLGVLAVVDRLGWALAGLEARQAATDAWCDPGQLWSRPLDWWLTATASTGCLLALAVASLLATLTMADLLVGKHCRFVRLISCALTPEAGRRLLLSACGVGVAGSALLGPAAMADDTAGAGRCHAACSVHLGGLPLPELPSRHGRAAGAPRLVVVEAGDSLWRISERLLPDGTSVTHLAAFVDHLYAENRAVIGPDRDLIFPGMHLVAPEGPT